MLNEFIVYLFCNEVIVSCYELGQLTQYINVIQWNALWKT